MKIKPLTKYDKGLLLVVLVFGILSLLFYSQEKKLDKEYEIKIQKELKDLQTINSLSEKILNKEIQAKAVSIYDITKSRKIFGYHDEYPLPLASLIKMLTVVVALENDTSGYVVIDDNSLNEIGDNGLVAGELWKTETLSKFALIASSNDAAKNLTIYDERFIKKMYEKGLELGLEKVSINNVTGLDSNSYTAGATGTAQDVNMLASYALNAHPFVFRATSLPKAIFVLPNGNKHEALNTNTLLGNIPNVLMSKTGFTYTAGGNLVVIFKNKENHDIAVTVLGSTMDGRFQDVEKIIDILYN